MTTSRYTDYAGRRVIVTGGGGAGIGAALVRELLEYGAEVYVLDLADAPPGVAGFFRTDLRDAGAIDDAVDAIGPAVHAVFHCAGIQGRPFTPLDVVTVNFLAVRHLTDRVLPLMIEGGAIAAVAAGAAGRWETRLEPLLELVTRTDFETGRDWVEAHPDLVADDGYKVSKQAVAVWVQWASAELGPRGVRLNCTWPGYTETPMLRSFAASIGDQHFVGFPRPIEDRNATPEEQAHALVFLNSPAASYVNGVCLPVDGGYYAGVATGRWGTRQRPVVTDD